MFNFLTKKKPQEEKLYRTILNLSRNKSLYLNLNLKDNFQNRINLIFFHISFLFININTLSDKSKSKKFSQKMFDFIFDKIEENMREIGFSDTSVNKNMKFLVKNFYNILLNCENYRNISTKEKSIFLFKYIDLNTSSNMVKNNELIDYFDKFSAFCLDLSSDNVLKGEINFNYN
jgi:hypothetical protein